MDFDNWKVYGDTSITDGLVWNGQQQKFLIVVIGQGNDIDMFMYTHDFGNVHTS